jgi:hypothetical protein
MSIYTHKHHIIPRHMGGTDDADNLIEVTVEQHALLHKQLWEDLGYQEDYIAWRCLSGQISSEEAKILAIKEARKRDIGKKKKPHSIETKRKISESRKGQRVSEEAKKKMSDWAKTQKHSLERRESQRRKMQDYWNRKKLAINHSL